MSLLSTHELVAHYGDFQALYGVDFDIQPGEVVAIIGANGAGKSTLLRSLAGLNRVAREVIKLGGEAIGGLSPFEIVKKGIALVPEGRRLFPSLSVEENLVIGGNPKRSGHWSLQKVYELFPILKERRNHPGTALSGGQQQMVAIGRALMSNPQLLLCDELSLGLAPTVIKDIYAAMPRIVNEGAAVIVVEQDISQAMRVSQRLYCLQEGRVSLSGKCGDFSHEQITAAYFGTGH